jgi:hypothetical protein
VSVCDEIECPRHLPKRYPRVGAEQRPAYLWHTTWPLWGQVSFCAVVLPESEARLLANPDVVAQIDRTIAEPHSRVRRGRPHRKD